MSDPRLPRTTAAEGSDQAWVTIVGAVPVPVTDKTLIRVRLGSNPTSQAQLAARQSFKDEQTTLDSGSEQIQWSAAQFKWGEGGADVIVEARLVSRDIDNELQSWDTQDSTPAAPASDAPGCRINFQPLEPHDQAPSRIPIEVVWVLGEMANECGAQKDQNPLDRRWRYPWCGPGAPAATLGTDLNRPIHVP